MENELPGTYLRAMSLKKMGVDGTADLPVAPQESARAVGLRYVSDETPGFRRARKGTGFRYLNQNGKEIRDSRHLARIKALAIPPAWTDVWICPITHGHLQATGRDARGRKQHRYHSQWRSVRDETKYARLIAFARALPKVRRRVARDLKLPGLSRQRVLATVVKLLEVSFIRVGNEEYARQNRSFGLTTLQDRHVTVSGGKLRFRFRGKSKKDHDVDIEDARLAKIVKKCQELPGQELFQYLADDGKQRDVKSEDVNEYLREVTGSDFSAKDFRTWAGTVLAAVALREFEKFDSEAQAKKNVVRAVEKVAERLGNTPTVCRKGYVHPAIIESYFEGTMVKALRQRTEERLRRSLWQLQPEEAAVLGMLQQRLAMTRNRMSLRQQLSASLKAQQRKRPKPRK
jgi:DNA topoisomerase I